MCITVAEDYRVDQHPIWTKKLAQADHGHNSVGEHESSLDCQCCSNLVASSHLCNVDSDRGNGRT